MKAAGAHSAYFLPYIRAHRARWAALPSLEADLERFLMGAVAAWPKLGVPTRDFLRHAAEHLDGGVQSLDSLHGGDLYLALACARGEPSALAEFEKRFLPHVARYIKTIDPSPAFADEVAQLVRHHVLLPLDDAAPRIAQYGGGGPLGAWVRAVAVRTALALRRRKKPHVSLDEERAGQLQSKDPDPEIDYLKTRYSREFREALKHALGSLPKKERSILSLYFIDGLSTPAIGRLYRVNASTVTRWIARTRKTILEQTHERLRASLKVSTGELESLFALVRSQLDQSITKFLK